MKHTSLRSRIILSLVIIVTVTSSLFAFGVLLLKQQLEEVIFGQMVHEQLQVIMREVREGNFHDNHLYEDWSLFREKGTGPDPLISALPDGSHHHIVVDGHYYQVEIATENGERFYLTYDISEWESLEHTLLAWLGAGIGILAIVTLFMGIGASRTILAPVVAFTRRIKSINPDERQIQVANEFQGSEISQIAGAFDQYLARMDSFVERERSFTAAASHELRNPLSVMLGALDVIEAGHQDEITLRATARLKRAIGDMQAFIEAALFLSREESSTVSNPGATRSLRETILSLIEDSRRSIEGRGITLNTDLDDDFSLTQPASLIKITINNLLRNAIEHTRNGSISITLKDHCFIIEDEGEGISDDNLSHIFVRSFSTKSQGYGMGLDLVKRICDRFHWAISITSEPGKGTRAVVRFRPPGPEE